MKIRVLVLLCFGIAGWSPPLPAQRWVDSLETAIAVAPSDSQAIAQYAVLMEALLGANEIEQLDRVADRALKRSREAGHPHGIQNALYYKVITLDELGKSEEAFPLIDQAISICFQSGDSLSAARHFLNRGIINYRTVNYSESLKDYFSAYRIYDQHGEKKSLSHTLNNIAIIYRSQDQHREAIDIYSQSLALKREMQDSLGMATTYHNLGLLYSYTDQMEAAIQHLTSALELYQRFDREADVAQALLSIGIMYLNLGCYEEGEAVLVRAQKYYDQYPEPIREVNTSFALGSIAEAYGRLEEAEQYYTKALELSRQLNQYKNIQEISRKLASIQFEQDKTRSAYLFLEEAYRLQDTLKEDKRLELMEEMQAKFEVVQKEKELALNELELGARTRQRNGLMALLAIFLLLGGLIVSLLRQRVRISRQETALQRQQVRQLQQEKQLAALSALMEGEEKERMRIAADLHDGLGGLLTSIKAHFSYLPVSEDHREVYQKTDSLISNACVEVRRISHNMLPRALAFSGLQGAVEDLLLDLKQQGYECGLETVGLDEAMLQDKALPIYRILQELLNNVVKHAQASQIFVQLFQREQMLFIMVEDDGQGFEPEDPHRQGGIGLSNIASRVKIMGGEAEWDSIPGQGTSVSIRIPVAPAK
jgi:signal transduction histidine kinase